MGRSEAESAGGGAYDEVFVPHYKSYAHSMAVRGQPQGAAVPARASHRPDFMLPPGVRGVERGRGGLAQMSPPVSVLPSQGSTQQQPWPSSGDGSSMSSGDNFQQSYVGMHQKLSQFQVALRDSERAREDGERETHALRLYVTNVETAAAGLVSRVQDLENLLTLSSAMQHGQDVEQLRGKVATEALKEVQKQAAAAVQAISAAREATMELDKVKRESHALATAQEAEIERLSMEAAECRMLYEARGKQIQEMTNQVVKLQRQLDQQNVKLEESHKTLQIEVAAYQKKYEAAKFAAMEKAGQCNELMQALELSTAVGKAAERKLEELLSEKKESLHKNELLEQQVKELQSQDMGGAKAHYDRELRQVRAALGGEKAHLLDDLAQLRRSNQTTSQGEMDWHEKFLRAPTPTGPPHRSSEHGTVSQQSSNAFAIAKSHGVGTLPSGLDHADPPRGSSPSKLGECSYSQEEVEEGRLSVSSSASASGSCGTRETGRDAMWTNCTSDSSSKGNIGGPHGGNSPLEHSLCKTDLAYGKHRHRNIQFQGLRNSGVNEGLGTTPDGDTGETSLALKDLNLLAAAQREIAKLKEINQQLVAACQ